MWGAGSHRHPTISPAPRCPSDGDSATIPLTPGITRPPAAPTGRHATAQCHIPAGTFTMGDAQGDGKPGSGERPAQEVQLTAYTIDATSVSNADFAHFVDATGYTTEAEAFGSSSVFHLVVAAAKEEVVGR